MSLKVTILFRGIRVEISGLRHIITMSLEITILFRGIRVEVSGLKMCAACVEISVQSS
jgi:hypothetical protein